jgi:hypothetical protein
MRRPRRVAPDVTFGRRAVVGSLTNERQPRGAVLVAAPAECYTYMVSLLPGREPRPGQRWRGRDGSAVTIDAIHGQTASVSVLDPVNGPNAANAFGLAAFGDMVLVDDPNQPSWRVVVNAGISWPTSHALTSVGTVEGATSHQVRANELTPGRSEHALSRPTKRKPVRGAGACKEFGSP